MAFAREMERRGAGEILLTSMDRDGTRAGYNLPLTRAVADAVGIPVIASGGVGTLGASGRGRDRGARLGGARGLDLPLRPALDRRGQGGDGGGRHCGEALMSDVLARLFATIEARAGADPAASHTAAMLAKGPRKCAEKFGEEAVEAIVAAAAGDRAGLVHEAADVLYHLQVMLKAGGVAWGEVLAELERREGRSGIAEKAGRATDRAVGAPLRAGVAPRRCAGCPCVTRWRAVRPAADPRAAGRANLPDRARRSGRPGEEVGDQPEAGGLALLRVELGAEEVVAADGGGDRAAVVGAGEAVGRVGGDEVVGVDEIGVVAGGDAGEERVGGEDLERVPAHVRDLERGVGGGEADDLAGDPAEARGVAVLAADGRQHLLADADAEEGRAAADRALLDRLEEAGDGEEAGAAVGEGADAGQHDAVGARGRRRGRRRR